MTSPFSVAAAPVETPRDTDPDAGFGALRTPQGNLPLKLMAVDARLTGLLADVSVRQTYVNAHEVPLEATYVFPLPDRAAVTRFRLEVGERVVEGTLKERGEARREYAVAIQAGHRAAIAEEDRPGVFTMRVGNLMPGEEATVWLSLSGPLPVTEGEVTFRFPLVVAPRYVPGRPLPGASVGSGTARDTDAVPDASRITPPVLLPGYPNPVRLSIDVDVDPAGLPLGALRATLPVVEEAGEGGRRHVRVQPPVAGDCDVRLEQDFVLRFALGQDELASSLAVHRAAGDDEEGTFLLTLVPPRLAAPPRPRDVVFVLDRSGSMEGWKIVTARRAVARMVDTLTDRDRFAVYAFDSVLETPLGRDGALQPATDRNRFRAVEFLSGLTARGGTEMARPLDQAVTTLGAQQEHDAVLVLVTDGQVGNEDQVLKTLGPRLGRIRVFTLGVDRAVNAAFLQRLAQLGGGLSELVESEDRLDEVMDRVHRRIGTPVLTSLSLAPAASGTAGGGFAAAGHEQDLAERGPAFPRERAERATEGEVLVPGSVVPARLPDLFAGTPVQVLGRLRGRTALVVSATDAAGRTWSRRLEPDDRAAPAITHAWARGQVRQLEDRFVVTREASLERRIVDTSLRFGVLSRFTAFVAVDRVETVNAGGAQHKVTQPVEQPAGWTGKQDEAPTRQAAAPAGAPALPSFLQGANVVRKLASGAMGEVYLLEREVSHEEAASPAGFARNGPTSGPACPPMAPPAGSSVAPPAGGRCLLDDRTGSSGASASRLTCQGSTLSGTPRTFPEAPHPAAAPTLHEAALYGARGSFAPPPSGGGGLGQAPPELIPPAYRPAGSGGVVEAPARRGPVRVALVLVLLLLLAALALGWAFFRGVPTETGRAPAGPDSTCTDSTRLAVR